MKTNVNENRTNFELFGRQDAPVVMLTHALGSSMRMWDPQIDCLRPEFRILRYDVRGHGGTDATDEPYSLELLTRDAIALLDALKISRVHFVGLSLGGMIGQHVALSYPDRLLSLTLCDTTSVMPAETQPLWQERIELARREGMKALVDDTLARWFTPAFRDKRDPMMNLIRRIFLSTPVDGFVGCCEAIRSLDCAGKLGGIRLPTLVMVGSDDSGTPVSASESISEEIVGSTLRVISSAAHLSNIEQADVFNRHLLKFLRHR